jgi:diguanylate cyclase (GGDEF)-like protein
VAVAVAAFVVGSVGSFLAANVAARNSAQVAHQSFVVSSEEIASTLKLAIQHEQDLVVNAGAFFVGNRNPTQTQYREWLTASRTFSQYPELTGIAEVVVVTQAQLPAFAAQAVRDPAGSLSANGTFQVIPSGVRPYYCFANVAKSRSGASLTPAAYDYCDSVLASKFLQARDSGKGAYYPFGLGKSEILVVGTPVYSTGTVPATLSARRADFIGWTGTQVVPSELLADALVNHPRTQVALVYGASSPAVSFNFGVAPPHAQSTTISLDNGWRVQAFGVPSAAGIVNNVNALTVLLGGVLFSLLLGALILVLGTGRTRAMVMVHERTDELQHQALHDSLTGLPNRALILDRISQMLARARRDHIRVAVLFLDLDNFKDINDTMGHIAGDQLLIGVGTRLANALRGGDTVGRLGGDEFVILAEGASLLPGAEALAVRVLDVMKTPFEIAASDVPISVSFSIGIAEGVRNKPEDLLRDADIAMYRAKSMGRQRAVVFQPEMQKVVDEHRTMMVDLSGGLEAHQFFLMYQPTVDLATGEFTGVEALLRWRHPLRGVVLPDDFIPALETSGLIVSVGLWVLQEACRQGAMWDSLGHRFSVSVNVSVQQLEQDRIVSDVRNALIDSGLDPARLILEITESTLMHDIPATLPRLRALKEIGVQLAIDDFGTGYSSLAYLRQFPIDILKIDRGFVAGIVDTKEAAALVHALVQLGQALGIETIAEGVESDEQRRHLINEKVDTGQGFLFSRPLEAKAVDQFLRDWVVQPELT